jgi:hypothetical protein
MSLLDFLRPQGAQAPGSMSQPRQSGLSLLLGSPEARMAMAGQLMGNQGNAANFGNAMTAGALGIGKQRELQAQTAQDNKTYEFFKTQAPEFAQMIDAGMPVNQAWQTYTQQRFAKEKGQGIINAGAGNLYDSENDKWLSAPGGGAEGIAGLTPVWLRDKNTNQMVLGQMTKDGKVLKSQLPEGDYEPVGPYEKSFETNRGAKAGEAVGTAEGALPGVSQMAQHIASQVEDLKNDPYLPNMLGPVDSRLPNVTADAARVQGKIDQLKGGAFLQARQMLKGGGAITDYEGQKAEAAWTRLQTAQRPEDFTAALDEFNYYVQQGLQKLQQQAGQGAPRAPGYGPPASGAVDYKSKYGLD